MRTAIACLLTLAAAGAEPFVRTIHNPFGDQWPLEHVYFDLSPAEAAGPLTCTVQGHTRPTQPERVTVAGEPRVRLWTVATILGREAKGDVTATLAPGTAPSALTVRDDGECFVIDNGVYTARIRHYHAGLAGPTPLERLPHPLAGLKVDGQDRWDARARFEGPALITSARTELLAQGPVHVDLLVTLDGPAAPATGEPDGTTEAVPLASGKQSFAFPPNTIPRETVPRRTSHYEARLRIVLDDPWLDWTERAHFPRDPAIKPWGFSQEVVDLGGPTGLPLDTAMWVRWFEWDKFGGNIDLQFAPARQRPAQLGRPFAMLRPIWNQGGGGAQDFFLTSGGAQAANRDVPAVGVVAAFPSKWVGPFAQTIVARADQGDRGSLRLPLVPADVPGLWYGQRAFGLCAGPRRLFDTTGAMNGLVRRHTDWTLNALLNRYVLTWPRHPAQAGPHLLATRERLAQLRAEFAAGRLTAEPGDDPALLDLLAGRPVKPPKSPESWLWRDRRYQDDFLNPTSRPTRTLADIKRVDLLADGRPAGDADTAALAYIVSDPDYWMGWRQGWLPGNPNFHTDKYASALYLAGTILDHPHARDWLEFARRNFDEDLARVLTAPDGVGVECPGYSGYALGLLLPMAQAFANLGQDAIGTAGPLLKATGTWHRQLLTPVDPRLGRRHEAPIGDTHRWDSGLGDWFVDLGRLFAQTDPRYAAGLEAVWRELAGSGAKAGRSRLTRLLSPQPALPPVALAELDWQSQAFAGFGAVLRSNFGTPRETFVSLKAGAVRGHYHNDENSFHYYCNGTPIALDYNCSYHPRGDHAALHNTLTFGRDGTVTHNERHAPVEAAEQLLSDARVVSCERTPTVDTVVSERRGASLTMSPLFPEDAEFSRDYPTRGVEPLVHRRTLKLIKHPAGSPFTDYLLVRDETTSREPQQLNLHLLARDLRITGDRIDATGQLGLDMAVYLVRAPGAKVTQRAWWYADEWLNGLGEYALGEHESLAERDARLAGKLPGADWTPTYGDARKGETQGWLERIAATKGLALVPPAGWRARWTYGEYQRWLRVETAGGETLVWVLYPFARGGEVPRFERVGEQGVRVTVGPAAEVVTLANAD